MLARYLRGEHGPVWNELRAHEALGGELLRSGIDPELVDPFLLYLAPDYLHKADISGGAPYGIELPFFGADPVFANEAHDLPFVDYLRLCFRWAGFPRLERSVDHPDIPEFLAAMSKGFAPF